MFKQFARAGRVNVNFGKSFNASKFKANNFQQRKVSYNVSQSNNNGALLTGAAGTALLLGGGYYAFKYWNEPRKITTYSASGEPLVYTDMSTVLSQNVHKYLFNVFSYVGAGAAITAGTAVAAFRAGFAESIARMGPLGAIGMFAGTMGLMIATRAVNPDNAMLKHAMFTAFNGVMGLSLCTLGYFAPASVLIRAGLCTFGVVGGLAIVAMNAKDERFLMWGGALSSALLVLVISSFARIFLPARFARLGSALDALWLYGGLAIFSGLMLYDTQIVMRNAKQYENIKALAAQQGGARALEHIPQPDYIAESIAIYLNLINIFIRFVMILSNSKKK